MVTAKELKKYKKVVDNKMRAYGDCNFQKKIIRVNRVKARKDPSRVRPINKHAKRYPDVLDTMVHEENHVKHPRMHEKNIRKKTLRDIKKMTPKQKQKIYSRYKNKIKK